MGLGGVPGATAWAPESVRQRHQITETLIGSRFETNEQGRQMVGFTASGNVTQRHRSYQLIWQAQARQNRHVRIVVEQKGQHADDVIEHRLGIDLSDQGRPTLSEERCLIEGMPIEDVGALHRIHHDPGPGQIGERHTRDDVNVAVVAGGEIRHRPFGDDGTSRHRVGDIAAFGVGDQTLDDRCICLVQRIGMLVDRVEGFPARAHQVELISCRVTGRAKETPPRLGLVECLTSDGQYVIKTRGPQTNHTNHQQPHRSNTQTASL